MSPESTGASPTIHLSKVDFPDPDDPSRTQKQPGLRSSEKSVRTLGPSLYDLNTLESFSAGSVDAEVGWSVILEIVPW